MARKARSSSRRPSMGDRAKQASGRGLAAWLRFTFIEDRQKIFGKVSHVLINWVALLLLMVLVWQLAPSQPLIVAGFLAAGIIYTAARSSRHLPAQTRALTALHKKTASTFKHPVSSEPQERVVVTRWGAPKRLPKQKSMSRPLAGAVEYEQSTPLAKQAGRGVGERTLFAALAPFIGDGEAILFDHDRETVMGFQIVPANDSRVAKQRVTGAIVALMNDQFPVKGVHAEPIDVAIEWPDDEPEPGTDPVPSRIMVAYGAFDASSEATRNSIEDNLDARLASSVAWIGDWSAPGQFSVEAVSHDSDAAQRKQATKRLRSTVNGAVARIGAKVAMSTITRVDKWIDNGSAVSNTPRAITVEMGVADMSDTRARQSMEGTLDRALGAEYSDRVWLYEWEHAPKTVLSAQAVPRGSMNGRRKIEHLRLRSVVQSKFRAPRSAEQPDLEVVAWGKPDPVTFFEQPITTKKIPWDSKASKVRVTFGELDVTKPETRRAFELHFNSLAEGVNDWRYSWDAQAGVCDIESVPVLPSIVPFPAVGTREHDYWHTEFRKGRVAVGPARGGFTPWLDFNRSPHMIVGGSTGAGKSFLLNLVLYGALANIDVFELIVVDPKATDFRWTRYYPNVLRYAVTDARESIMQINEACKVAHAKMMERQNLLSRFACDNLGQLRQRCADGLIDPSEMRLEDVPKRLLLFFDEGGAAFTPTKDKDLKVVQDEARTLVEQIGMLGRAMEVNIVMAAQKPSAENIGTAIREQLVIKIAVGALNTATSIQVLGNNLATELLQGAGPGRGVLVDDTGRELVFQTFFLPRKDSKNPGDPEQTVEGISERVSAQLEVAGWVSVPKVDEMVIPDPEAGDNATKTVQVRSDQWVRHDMIEV